MVAPALPKFAAVGIKAVILARGRVPIYPHWLDLHPHVWPDGGFGDAVLLLCAAR